MRSDRSASRGRLAAGLTLAVAGLALVGCAPKGGPVCRPVFSWAVPAHGCAAGEVMAPPDVVEPPPVVAEPPPEPLPIEPLKAELKGDAIELAEKVQFETGSSTLLSASNDLLDQVAKILTDHPEITKVRIEGHTDSVGSNSKNQKLSQERATAVRAYLEGAGIAGDRMLAKGFGEAKPIADNKTPEGRDQNRRVEITVLERAP